MKHLTTFEGFGWKNLFKSKKQKQAEEMFGTKDLSKPEEHSLAREEEFYPQPKSEPLYKTGDVCYFVTPGFENDPEHFHETMVIKGDGEWNTYGEGYWEYPIKGKANNCPEGLLKLKSK